ncbi:MAG TPA: biotin/lipoyl-containing protein, partial [Opitutaceae bacterium]|nr:biotin/lipoyl-containing protein [Opitutaceae bacterium]
MPLLDVKVPALGESITSGVLAQWRIRDGDLVAKDQPLYELETDKITSEGTAEAAGRIALKVAAGAEVKIGQVVAVIDTGSAIADTGKSTPAPTAETAKAPPAGTPASPAVRRIASETGVDPTKVTGSGKGGRVTKGDMLAASDLGKRIPDTGKKEPTSPMTPPVPPEPIRSPVSEIANPTAKQTRRKLTPLRQRLAQRLVQAQREAAMLTTFNEVDLSAVRELRARYQEEFTK